ncbi:carbonic anhydrase [Marchantia polymorpha subsp. ruderalis]|uniref:Alpha-carbonic anhydrase domain-containing protein n=2 Tax=Marchantia polymorpha TaxID=3197 RepID=A0A2R6WCP8_MARPO|nr:hypothetical protein MARPO_0109s0051 [Marchantia polymorpha]BBN02671.1 hypothetical protein Mp_2g17100 [Marchantia polymorpha subsp. ruderalis]|eukprot:PTQ31630.1 hypothetical protein MARPO_0109s0051 [Marchantia polymorpha]
MSTCFGSGSQPKCPQGLRSEIGEISQCFICRYFPVDFEQVYDTYYPTHQFRCLILGMQANMMSSHRFSAILWLSLVAISSTAVAHENILKTTVDPSNDAWDYSDGPNGPAHWGDLNPSWRTCNEGQNQSPINIDTSNLVYDEKLDAPATHEYVETPAYVLNNGHTAQVIWPAGWIYIDGKNYSMTGFQFHSPSEHTIDGTSYPLEMQIVHMTDEGDYAVVVILSSIQEMVNGWVAQFWDQIPSLSSIWQPVPVGNLSPDGFRVNFSKYYRYSGSLTSPDCQENVIWTVLSTVYEISPGQIEHLRSVFPDANNRPIQPLGDRKVSYPKASA